MKKRESIDSKYKWDLTKIIENESKFDILSAEVLALTDKIINYRGTIASSKENFLNFLKINEELDRKLSLIVVYSNLLCDTDTASAYGQKLKGKAEKLLEEVNSKIYFINNEILSHDKSIYKNYLKENKELAKYDFYIESIFRYKDHTLSYEEEKIISLANNTFGTGDEVFYNLDNSDIKLGFIKDENGKRVELTNSNYYTYLTNNNRNVRITAFKHMYKYFSGLKNTLASSLKGTIKEAAFNSSVRKYNSSLEEVLFDDNIDLNVYTGLINTVHNNLDLMYDYMKIKKEMLNLDKLHMYDMYVDLVKKEAKKIPFEEGKQIVLEALKPLEKEYVENLKKAFDNSWIDVYPSPGKKSGAYQWGCYDTSPFVLLNYNDTVDDVSTMAHELGHAMHSYYSKNNQDYIYSNYSIFIAEIASTVNEILLNDYLYKNAKTKDEKISYLTDFLEKLRTTLYRQTMFAEFEYVIHDKEKNGIPLIEEDFSNTYYELNKLYYGKNVVSDSLIKYEWARIPHFYTPFYVYTYATGIASAVSLASSILKGDKKATDDYLKLLSSGSSDYPLNLLKKAGVDLNSSYPIEKALTLFKEKLNELKDLM